MILRKLAHRFSKPKTSSCFIYKRPLILRYFSDLNHLKKESGAKLNAMLSLQIVKAKNFDKKKEIFDAFKPKFNIINHSAFLNKLDKVPNAKRLYQHNDKIEFLEEVFLDIKSKFQEEENQLTPRLCSNILLYLTGLKQKLSRPSQPLEDLIEIFFKKSISLRHEMKNQEYSNLIYAIWKLEKFNFLQEIQEEILEETKGMKVIALCIIYTVVHDTKVFDKKIQNKFAQFLVNRQSFITQLNNRDFSTIMYFVNHSAIDQDLKENLEKSFLKFFQMQWVNFDPQSMTSICQSLLKTENQTLRNKVLQRFRAEYLEKFGVLKQNKKLALFLLMNHEFEEIQENSENMKIVEATSTAILENMGVKQIDHLVNMLYHFPLKIQGNKLKNILEVIESENFKIFEENKSDQILDFNNVTKLVIGYGVQRKNNHIGEKMLTKLMDVALDCLYKNSQKNQEAIEINIEVSLVSFVKFINSFLELDEKYGFKHSLEVVRGFQNALVENEVNLKCRSQEEMEKAVQIYQGIQGFMTKRKEQVSEINSKLKELERIIFK